ncbi:MAG TPA: hypothetical protein PLU43_09350 [Lachnospiraceae bacterium]|nr:hypothetical protein [Lachnospiraceae bacterium]
MKLIDYLKTQLKKDWKIMLVLTAASGKEPFYEQLGFICRPNEQLGSGMSRWLLSE